MEEPQKVIDVMNLHITHNQFLGSFNSCRNQFNQVQSNDLMITQHEQQQQQWQETIDPLKLVLGKVIGRGFYGVVYKGSYHGQTVAGKTNSLVCYLLVEFKGALCLSFFKCMKNDFREEACLWQKLDHPKVYLI
ncbi:putative kinase-like domain superfamily, kinase, ATP binding protein [Helianthus anomalus]